MAVVLQSNGTPGPDIISIEPVPPDIWDAYHHMLRIRRFEERAAEAYTATRIGGFLHLAIGEEAVCVGALTALKEHDHLITHYRDHGYALTRGLSAQRCMAELYGKSTGVCGGRGGSMHMADAQRRFWGGYAIVGGHMPLAVGLAWAAKVQEPNTIVMCVFGDGASNIGEFHESCNLAATWRLPVVFLCENNGFGMGTRASRASAVPDVALRAAAYGMPAWQVDGMDVHDVAVGVGEAAAFVRRGEGPVIVEAHTYRFRGHSMVDAELYRNKEEVEKMRARDPIERVGEELRALDSERVDEIAAAVDAEMKQAVDFAENSPFPDVSSMEEGIVVRPDGLHS